MLTAVCEKPSGARALKHQLTASSPSEYNHVSLLLQSMKQNATPALFHVVFQRGLEDSELFILALLARKGLRQTMTDIQIYAE